MAVVPSWALNVAIERDTTTRGVECQQVTEQGTVAKPAGRLEEGKQTDFWCIGPFDLLL